MLTQIANIHHSILPKVGEVVQISERLRRTHFYPVKRWRVEFCNLCDSVRPWSLGIHLVHLVSLCGRYRCCLSGHWCEVEA